MKKHDGLIRACLHQDVTDGDVAERIGFLLSKSSVYAALMRAEACMSRKQEDAWAWYEHVLLAALQESQWDVVITLSLQLLAHTMRVEWIRALLQAALCGNNDQAWCWGMHRVVRGVHDQKISEALATDIIGLSCLDALMQQWHISKAQAAILRAELVEKIPSLASRIHFYLQSRAQGQGFELLEYFV